MLEGLKAALAAEEVQTDGRGFAAAVIVPLICRETEEEALIAAAGGVRINGSKDCGPESGEGLVGARSKGIDLLFELRSRNLRRSSGEVGFPGGLLEPGERPYEAALRELEEELGIGAKQVTLLGRLPRLFRRRNELVTPYVCHISGRFPLKVQSEEVAEVFTIPLAYLLAHPLNEARMIEERHLSRGFPHHLLPQGEWRSRSEYPTYYLEYQDKLIWGLTAEIVRRLLVLLNPPDKAARPAGEP